MTPIKSATVLALATFLFGCAADDTDSYYVAPVPQLDDSNMSYSIKTKPAPMDPARKISEQDCTKSADATQGNVRCK